MQTRRDAAQAQRNVVGPSHRRGAVGPQGAGRARGPRSLAQEKQKEGLVAQVRSRKREFETPDRRSCRAESNAITAFLRGVQKGQGKAISGKGILASPIPGAAITSGYGSRVHPVYGDVRTHTGIDFRAATGTPVRAAGAGKVVYAGLAGRLRQHA